MDDANDPHPLTRALAWVDRQIAYRHAELTLLSHVRTQLRTIVGEGRGDGWAQVGSRAGENES